MKKFLKDFKSRTIDKEHAQNDQGAPTEKPFQLSSPALTDLYQYRYQHGTNLGSVFCLEKWLTGYMFPENALSSELGAVTESVKKDDIEATRQKFEKHWNEYVSDSDLDWMANEAKANSVRLPIGYWTLGPSFTKGTPFEPVAQVYTNAWTAVTHFISRCAARHIGVLVDLHGLPGGANSNDHSGTNSDHADLWTSKTNKSLAISCHTFLAQHLTQPNIIGLQLCNEASANPHLWSFYSSALAAIHPLAPTLPLYLSDAWSLASVLPELASRNHPSAANNPLYLDTHLYYCFSNPEAPEEHIAKAAAELQPLAEQPFAAAIVGEYSHVLSEESWAHASADKKPELVAAFGRAQSETHRKRAAGAYFWTARMDWMPGGEWGFRAQVEAGNVQVPDWIGLRREEVGERLRRADKGRDGKRRDTVGAHVAYWDGKGGQYKHELFEWGWDTGFVDARWMYGWRSSEGLEGADRLGDIGMWALKRMREARPGEKHGWEFEHGIRQGIRDFYELVGLE